MNIKVAAFTVNEKSSNTNIFKGWFEYFSTNPALDIGQAEGAFVMGLGYWLTEECKYDPTTGELVTNDTWVRLKS